MSSGSLKADHRAIRPIIALAVGGYMVFDGTAQVVTGSHVGLGFGPWSLFVSALGINPYSMGFPFILLGLFSISFVIGVLMRQRWVWYGAIVPAAATLWYLPVGTKLSIVYILVLRHYRNR